MNIGSALQLKSLVHRSFYDDGTERAALTYKAPKGQTFVCLLIGTTDDGKGLDPNEALVALGWRPPEAPGEGSTP